MSGTSFSPLDSYLSQIKSWADEGKTNTQIVAEFRTEYDIVTSEASIRRAKRRDENIVQYGLQQENARLGTKRIPALQINGDEATAISPVTGVPMSIPELMGLYKLDPKEWEADKPVASWWGDSENPNYQLKVKFARKKPYTLIIPARTEGAYIAPKRVVDQRKVKTILLYGDQQAPFVDWEIFEGMLNLTKEFQPSMIIDPGDGRDFPSTSHHRTWPEWAASAQECIDIKYMLDREMRRANENAEIIQFIGNHDCRLASYMMEKAPAAYGLTPACADDEERMLEAYSIRNLGRLDELKIELVSNEKEAYDQARFMISDALGVEHGNKTGKDPALKAQHRRTFGVLMGHTHGQSINHIVTYDHNNEAQVHVAVELGTGAIRDRGIGFAPNPNWVGGGAWVSLHEDGSYHIELITSKFGKLHFRDKRY